MDLQLIERLMQMLDRSNLNELEVTEGNLHIRLAKMPTEPGLEPTRPASADRASSGASGEAEQAMQTDEELHVIAAGLPGTFYRAPSPDADPFVKEGDRIADGQQIAIVEAMKMMNPVESDVNGVIVDILLADAAPVTAGTPLFHVRKG
ncbi:MAG: acetyl-CoA carboxylase biotin carboxyl carrier protein [Shinella sp.]|nr:acetyl-CoA carboxylase biotin carboxyl carrier protein [Shinella sp.]